jgi:hypothetical protein
LCINSILPTALETTEATTKLPIACAFVLSASCAGLAIGATTTLLFNIASFNALFGVAGVVEQAVIENVIKADSVNLYVSVFISERFLLLN